MIRAILILVQLGLPLLPAGQCTCSRPDQSGKKRSVPAATTRMAASAIAKCKSGSKSRPPCQDPACPAHPSFARLETGVLSTPQLAVADDRVDCRAGTSQCQPRSAAHFRLTMVVSAGQLFRSTCAMLI